MVETTLSSAAYATETREKSYNETFMIFVHVDIEKKIKEHNIKKRDFAPQINISRTALNKYCRQKKVPLLSYFHCHKVCPEVFPEVKIELPGLGVLEMKGESNAKAKI